MWIRVVLCNGGDGGLFGVGWNGRGRRKWNSRVKRE